MIPKALYNHCDCRYSFHRLHDLNLSSDFQKGNTFCFYEHGKLWAIDVPNACQFTSQIEKRVPQYPEFSNRMCTIQ